MRNLGSTEDDFKKDSAHGVFADVPGDGNPDTFFGIENRNVLAGVGVDEDVHCFEGGANGA